MACKSENEKIKSSERTVDQQDLDGMIRVRKSVPNSEEQQITSHREITEREYISGSVTRLPPTPPDFLKTMCRMDSWIRIRLGDVTDYMKGTPYNILASCNKDLTLSMVSVKFHELRTWVSGGGSVDVQFYTERVTQLIRSGRPVNVESGLPKIMRFRVMSGKSVGHITSRKITFPRHIREMKFDVDDNVTPLFRMRGTPTGKEQLTVARVTFYGLPQMNMDLDDEDQATLAEMTTDNNNYLKNS